MQSTTRAGEGPGCEIIDCAVPWRAADDVPLDTIVFHHGLGACAAIWSGWTAALIEDFRLVRFDMRGHGSSPLPDGHQYSLQGMLDDLAGVVDAASRDQGAGERVHLVGESIGGTVVLAYAAAYPQRVATVTVCNGAHAGGAIENVNLWTDIIEQGGMAAWSAHMMEQRFYPGALSEPRRRWYEAQQAKCHPRAVLEAVDVLTRTDLTPRLGDLQMPVLLLHPDDSPFIPVEIMAGLKRSLKNARLEVFPNARHGLPYSHAHACAQSLRRFLAAFG